LLHGRYVKKSDKVAPSKKGRSGLVQMSPLTQDIIMQLNHLHLSVSDVSACAGIFARHLGFELVEASANGGFAVLSNSDGFVLVLMRHAKEIEPQQAYPAQFHVGFLLSEEQRVTALHASMEADGLHVSDLEFSRGARRFYCRASGGILIEIGHRS
jgi:catechol 2,3-dioxygenase-like lactoylglutathione lyase family enzyme